MPVAGLLLAAGAGRRYGGPKSLVPGWLAHAVGVLREGGCDDVHVVLGAQADQARALVPGGVAITIATDWDDGMAASLRAGLRGLLETAATGALVHLVDLPDVSAPVIQRVLNQAHGPQALARAAYDSRPGHPVLLGRAHWDGVLAGASGDAGARDYLSANPPSLIECGDLATGHDVDTQPRRDVDTQPRRDVDTQPRRDVDTNP
ncbi:nucleotidyltransferase family protein [Aeromicrobium sp. CF3.5]|uniref:nucleotidyltransferase family protein n=1 Tax=Aeromicrobium sp. CF3.5 TaxID=3373078 RepID=UPI003EE7B85C